ncbi:MAG: hypothetical protein K0S07_1634, partial [Chlamydiales bacterium]|nr:hypothetical protein [Chlamydiales bacterium]
PQMLLRMLNGVKASRIDDYLSPHIDLIWGDR